MGWSDCGDDSTGRPIGYAHDAICDHPECDKEIHRGLAYACGGMHGDDERSCDRYFCSRHLQFVKFDNDECGFVCASCAKAFPERDEDHE